MSLAQNQTTDLAVKIEALPTLPQIVYELSQVINDPMSSTGDVERIMAYDPSLTTTVLRLANSAYYSIPGGVSTLGRAVAYLGYDAVHQLVLSATIVKTLSTETAPYFDVSLFWKHSVGVAIACENIAQFIQLKNPQDLFTCGLVHDIGKIATFVLDAPYFQKVVMTAKNRKMSFHEAEKAIEGSEHTVIGSELIERWKLPRPLAVAAQYHHELKPQCRSGLTPDLNLIVDVVCLGNLLTHHLNYGHSGGFQDSTGHIPATVYERLSLQSTDLKILLRKTEDAFANAEGFLSIIGAL